MFKLFDITAEPAVSEAKELYYRDDGDLISYNTYFNSLSAGKIKKYTNINEIIFSDSVQICTESGRLKYSDRIAVDDIPDEAKLLYVQAEKDKEFISVYAEGIQKPVRPVIIICTYKREETVKANIGYLLRNRTGTEFEIVLVDNNSSIPPDIWKDEITVIHNVNNGGSGGFARGMKYAAEQKRFTHMIIMDDDVIIDFTAIKKLIGFLSFLKDEYRDLCIAGSMIRTDKPTVQFECGGYFSPDGVQTGYGYNFDLTDLNDLILNELDNQINYGGWWFMCMPLCFAEKGEYPAPYFIKYDDVEYALHCRAEVITLNGVGVWHEDFGSKYNSVSEYFNTRNYLFLMQKHSPGFDQRKAYRTARYLLLEKLCRQQYRMAEAVIIAYGDFLKGEKYLSEIDYESKLKQLHRLDYKMLGDEELSRIHGIRFDEQIYRKCSDQKFRRYMQPLLYGHLIPRFLCRKLSVTDVISDRKEHYFGADKTLHYNKTGKCGYVTKKSLIRILSLYTRLISKHNKFSGGRK